jgi:hypothetical protein
MKHPYESLTRNRDRRPAPSTNEATPATWIAAAMFAFILIVAFVVPIFHHLLERGQ